MTIQFNCPNCGSLIAFTDKHAGKGAKCLTCGQRLIIPAHSVIKPEKIEPPVEDELPVPGFYRELFIDSWNIFFDKNNFKAIVFVIAAVSFKFISAGFCCLGFLTYFGAWGYLFGFYLGIIYETAMGNDNFPEIEVGNSIDFIWVILKPILLFGVTLFVMELPFYIVVWASGKGNLELKELWNNGGMSNYLLIFLFTAGLFLFPLAILKVTVIQDIIELLGIRYFFKPVIKAFIPYTMAVALLATACFIESNSKQYYSLLGDSMPVIAANFSINLATQVVAITAMRSIGLFYRHYSCHFNY